MCKYIVFQLVFVFLCCLTSGYKFADPNYIPENLLECYQNPVPLLPMSIRTLIDIVRKIESYPYQTMDLRMETNAILNRYWRDGIERDPNVAAVPNVIPYSGSAGVEFYKFSLVRSLIPLSGGPLIPDDVLTISERCTLHHMLSSGIVIWERGDEYRVCPKAANQHQETSDQLTGAKKSSCPIQNGVVQSPYGTISPNHVLLGIASSLQRINVYQQSLVDGMPQRRNSRLYIVNYNKTIDSVWASTVAGDIAELMVFQLPVSGSPKFGPGGFWNDSLLPARYFLKTDYKGVLHNYWEDTDADILGGIDGLMVGEQVSNWNMPTPLRLSQALEMFYSNRGVQFSNQLRACNRQDFFGDRLSKQMDLIERQAVNFAELLTVNSVNYIMDSAFIEKNKAITSKLYKDYVAKLIEKYRRCSDRSEYSETRLRLNIIYDATWDTYTTLQVLTRISTDMDVSQYGSTLTVINGVTGNDIVNAANTVGELYLKWISVDKSAKEVRSTDLTNGFLKLKYIVESDDFRNSRSNPAADITLVLGKSSLLTDAAYDRITSTVRAVKSEIPDMRFVYVIRTADSQPWVKLTSLPYSQNDRIITMDDDNLETLYSSLLFLQDIPQSIIPPLCTAVASTTSEAFEIQQYVTPGVPRAYMIHPVYFCSSRFVDIEIANFNYGDAVFCLSRTPFGASKTPECTSIGKMVKSHIRIDNPCPSKLTTGLMQSWDSSCRPIYVNAMVQKSSNNCSENTCRYTDQIKFNFRISGIKCIQGFGVPCSSMTRSATLALVMWTAIFIWLT